MSKEEKNKMVPRLRFPEFEGLWKREKLEEIIDLLSGYAFQSDFFSTIGKKLLTPKNFTNYGYANFTKENTKYTTEDFDHKYLCKVGDLLLLLTDLTPSCELLGKPLLLTKNDGEVLLNQRIVKILPKDSIETRFLLCYFLSESYLKRIKETATGSTVRHSSSKIIGSTVIYLPSLPEQQKISSCLSSLDDLITAHSQKLESLKAHKKGLMQQLFPAESEKVPQLRFEEFKDNGEWEEKMLIDVAKDGFSNGVFNDPKKVGSGYKLINVLDMYIETPINEDRLTLIGISETEFARNKVEFGDLFFTRSSLVPAGIAQSNIYLGSSPDITFDGHLIRMRPNTSTVFPLFIHYLLKSNTVRSQLIAKGKAAIMTTIGQGDIASVEIRIPLIPEQQKIASCLSSLDELISVQGQKIEALKAHKKGLIQGLFPNTDMAIAGGNNAYDNGRNTGGDISMDGDNLRDDDDNNGKIPR